MKTSARNSASRSEEFAREAGKRRSSFLSDYFYFMKTHKKWWILPLILVLLAFGLLMALASTAAAPFIYTLF